MVEMKLGGFIRGENIRKEEFNEIEQHYKRLTGVWGKRAIESLLAGIRERDEKIVDLRKENERLHKITKAANEVLMDADIEGDVVMVNREAAETLATVLIETGYWSAETEEVD